LLSILFLNGSFLKFFNNSGSEIFMNIRGIWQSGGEGAVSQIGNQIPLLVIIVLIAVISFTAIFFYRKRKIQLKMAIAIIFLAVVSIGLIVFYVFLMTSKHNAVLVPGIKMFIPFLILIFAILAYRGIRKDEALVKSYDRIR
jgi:amino acid permease